MDETKLQPPVSTGSTLRRTRSGNLVAHGKQTTKRVGCPIHGFIELEPYMTEIIDTPEFQRLRYLQQLGVTALVFPGATHTRFEHSLGVSHLAGVMVTHLQKEQPDLKITDRDVQLVKIAGLCHDLGHGPFSHVFDNSFIKIQRPDIKWSHEDASIMMLESVIRENKLSYSSKEIQYLKELINPDRYPATRTEKKFLYDIVANYRNSMDVDKLDYLARDSYSLGFKYNFMSFMRLIETCRVIDDEICFSEKDAYTLYEIFHDRYSMFKRVYTHRTSKALEEMVCDVFRLADPALKISDAIYDPKKYLRLTDTLLREIEMSRDPKLAAAQALVERIRRRQLYKLVVETNLTGVRNAKSMKKKLSVDEIMRHNPEHSPLTAADLRVCFTTINYAKGQENPVDAVSFYSKWDGSTKKKISAQHVSAMIPGVFQEVYLRVYVTDCIDEKLMAAKKATDGLLKSISQIAGPMGIPAVDSAVDARSPPSSPGTPVMRSVIEGPESNEGLLAPPAVGSDPFSSPGKRLATDVFPSSSPCPSQKKPRLDSNRRGSSTGATRSIASELENAP